MRNVFGLGALVYLVLVLLMRSRGVFKVMNVCVLQILPFETEALGGQTPLP